MLNFVRYHIDNYFSWVQVRDKDKLHFVFDKLYWFININFKFININGWFIVTY